jgi:hypothetical protein
MFVQGLTAIIPVLAVFSGLFVPSSFSATNFLTTMRPMTHQNNPDSSSAAPSNSHSSAKTSE